MPALRKAREREKMTFESTTKLESRISVIISEELEERSGLASILQNQLTDTMARVDAERT